MSTFITFALAVGSVGLWTLRVALTARGSRLLGSAVAATEAVVFVVAFSHVTSSLDAPVQIVVYGLGVGLGTFLGLTVDRTIKGRRPGPALHPGNHSIDPSGQELEPTVSMSPGTGSTSPSGVSRAQATSPGDP